VSAKVKKPREVIQPRWGVYALRKKAERIGVVHAKTAEEALRRAHQEHDSHVPAPSRFRLSVRREA
jgi:hypothetical protein